MKIRFFTIIGIAVISSIAVFAAYDNISTDDVDHYNYKQTTQVIQDKYLNKTIFEWQQESHESLMFYHGIYGDKFFEDLGDW